METSWEGGYPERLDEKVLVKIKMEEDHQRDKTMKVMMERHAKKAVGKSMPSVEDFEYPPMAKKPSLLEQMKIAMERADRAAKEAAVIIDKYNASIESNQVQMGAISKLKPQDNYVHVDWHEIAELRWNIHKEKIVHQAQALYKGQSCVWTIAVTADGTFWKVYANNECVWTAGTEVEAAKFATKRLRDMLHWTQLEIDLFFGKTETPKIIPQEYGEW